MAKTKDELLAALQAIIAEAGEGQELNDEQMDRYEVLEKELAVAGRREEIQKRNAAYNTVTTSALNTGAVAKTDDTLDRAFNHYMRTGKENQDIVELRAQSVGTAAAGGFLVPDGFRMKMVDRMKDFGGLANVVESITTASGNPMEWPTLDDTANLGAIVAENGAPAAGADLTFGTKTLGAFKYMSVGAGGLPLKVSVELLQDSAFDVESLVARKLGERIARAQAPHLVSGTGTGQPLGIAVGGPSVAVPTGMTYTRLLAVVHAVDPAYRTNASWAFNDATLQAIRGVVDADGRPILTDSNMASSLGGSTLLGYPVTIDQAFPTYNPALTATRAGVFGDLREGYVIRRVRDLQLVVDPYSSAINGQVQFTAWARMDATQQNTNAYVTFTGTGV